MFFILFLKRQIETIDIIKRSRVVCGVRKLKFIIGMTTTYSPVEYWRSQNPISYEWTSSPAVITVYPQDANNVSQTVSLASIKRASLGKYIYYIAFSAQYNSKSKQPINSIFQQWWSPKWVAADAS